MSQWTHIAGVVRIDGLPVVVGLNQEQERAEIIKMIGNTCDFEDGDDKWDACNVPCGSEGSIQYSYAFSGRDEGIGHSITRSAIPIYGDLRDYSDAEAIIKWFKQVIAKFQPDHPENKGLFSIRDAVLSIEVEGRKEKTLCVWNEKEIVTTEIKRDTDLIW